MISGHRGWLGTRPSSLRRTVRGLRFRTKSGASALPGRRKPVARSTYSLRSSSIGMIVVLRSAEWIAGPQPEEPLEDGSERESGDDVARPMGQDHHTRQ